MTTNFERGLKAGQEHEVITIALNNTWGGKTKDGGHTSSYEKIGYHAGSVEFLDGVLASGCKVVKYTEVDGRLESYELDSNPWAANQYN